MQATRNCIPHPPKNEQHATESPFNHVLEVTSDDPVLRKDVKGSARGANHGSPGQDRPRQNARAVRTDISSWFVIWSDVHHPRPDGDIMATIGLT